MVIVEQRDYHVYTGKLPELVRLYEEEGIAIQQRGARRLRRRVHDRRRGALDVHEHVALRQLRRARERRAALQARDDWKAFLAKIQPLIHTQQNRILTPTPFSALQ